MPRKYNDTCAIVRECVFLRLSVNAMLIGAYGENASAEIIPLRPYFSFMFYSPETIKKHANLFFKLLSRSKAIEAVAKRESIASLFKEKVGEVDTTQWRELMAQATEQYASEEQRNAIEKDQISPLQMFRNLQLDPAMMRLVYQIKHSGFRQDALLNWMEFREISSIAEKLILIDKIQHQEGASVTPHSSGDLMTIALMDQVIQSAGRGDLSSAASILSRFEDTLYADEVLTRELANDDDGLSVITGSTFLGLEFAEGFEGEDDPQSQELFRQQLNIKWEYHCLKKILSKNSVLEVCEEKADIYKYFEQLYKHAKNNSSIWRDVTKHIFKPSQERKTDKLSLSDMELSLLDTKELLVLLKSLCKKYNIGGAPISNEADAGASPSAVASSTSVAGQNDAGEKRQPPSEPTLKRSKRNKPS